MLYAVDGVALGGWQLVDLALMALVAIELLSLIFLKVVIILLGALLYATGPITIGLVATESGAAIARAWASAVAMLIALPVVWATLFAVGALLVGDAGTAGPLIAGHSSIGSLLGGVLLAVAGAASLWLCLRAAREAMGLLRMQLGGLLALSHRGSAGRGRAWRQPQSSSVDSLRRFGARVAQAAGGAAGELAAAGAGGAAVVRGGRAVGYVGRHGALGTAAAGGASRCGARCPARRGARGPLARRRGRRAHGESRNRRLARQPAAAAAGSDPPRTATPPARRRRTCRGRRPRVSTATKAVVRPRLGAAASRAPRAAPRGRASGQTRPAAQRELTLRRRDRRAGKPRSAEQRTAATGRRSPAGAAAQVHAAAAERQPARAGQAMTPTLRRLNDRERYYGLTWPGWVALAAAGGVLYGAVRVSPFGLRATVTVVVLVLAFVASVALALQGQTIGPGRYLLALYRYRRAAKQLAPPTRARQARARPRRRAGRRRRSPSPCSTEPAHDRLAGGPPPGLACSSPMA